MCLAVCGGGDRRRRTGQESWLWHQGSVAPGSVVVVGARELTPAMLFTVLVLAVSGASTTASPVQKVIELLDDLKGKVESDLANEAKLMDEYSQWCDEEQNSKDDAITSSKRTIKDLSATIEDAKASITTLTSTIDELTQKISTSDKGKRGCRNPVQSGRERMGPETRGRPGLPVVERGEAMAGWRGGQAAGHARRGLRVVCRQACLRQNVSDAGLWMFMVQAGGRKSCGRQEARVRSRGLRGCLFVDRSFEQVGARLERGDRHSEQGAERLHGCGEGACPEGVGRVSLSSGYCRVLSERRVALRREWLIRDSFLRRCVAVLVLWAAG